MHNSTTNSLAHTLPQSQHSSVWGRLSGTEGAAWPDCRAPRSPVSQAGIATDGGTSPLSDLGVPLEAFLARGVSSEPVEALE